MHVILVSNDLVIFKIYIYSSHNLFVFFCMWSKFRVNSATVVELLYPVLEMFCIALLTSFDVGIIQTIVSLLASPPPARVRYGASYGVGLWLWLWPAQRDPHAIQYFAQCLSLALDLLTSFKTAISHFHSKFTAQQNFDTKLCLRWPPENSHSTWFSPNCHCLLDVQVCPGSVRQKSLGLSRMSRM